jgi:porin
MLGRSVKAAHMWGLAAALSSLPTIGAYAADLALKAPPPPYYVDGDFWTRPYLFGDLGRTELKNRGVDLSLTLVDEAVTNLTGGLKHNSAQAGQLAFQAMFDMAKLAGVQGGKIGFTLVDRFGQNENGIAGIPALQLTNEVFGRGNILRLTELYYSQKLFNDYLEVKGGRLPVGADFFFGKCEFVNLTFCGGQPGNILGGYIYNWPVSQWGGVVHANIAKDLQFSVGVYDSNPDYLTTNDASIYAAPGIPSSNPANGVLTVSELTWKPTFAGGLDGVWRLGGWYDDVATIDGGLPGIVAVGSTQGGVGFNLGDQRGRYGVYESILQRLTTEGRGPQGWYAFLNSSFGDHRTSFQDYQIALGFKHTGTFAGRPDDEIGFAVGTTHVNSAAVVVPGVANPNAGGNEVPFEAWYGWQATGWLNLKFDAQYVVNPGGRGFAAAPGGGFVKTDDAWVLGLRTTVKF